MHVIASLSEGHYNTNAWHWTWICIAIFQERMYVIQRLSIRYTLKSWGSGLILTWSGSIPPRKKNLVIGIRPSRKTTVLNYFSLNIYLVVLPWLTNKKKIKICEEFWIQIQMFNLYRTLRKKMDPGQSLFKVRTRNSALKYTKDYVIKSF